MPRDMNGEKKDLYVWFAEAIAQSRKRNYLRGAIAGICLIAIAPLNGCAAANKAETINESQKQERESFNILAEELNLSKVPESTLEKNYQKRSLAIREKLAAKDLDKLDAWWRRESIGDPHKYLLPVILARLSLQNEAAGQNYDPQNSWEILLKMDEDKRDIYHFRSYLDARIFFMFRNAMPAAVAKSYRSQLQSPRVLQWTEGGTENHMFMHRASGLALMDGSGLPVGDPASEATNEAWLRSELNKFLTIGQGEFHSSIYYGYSIGGLLNLYDFASNPELKKLAKGLLDWYATNMALRLSWGTAGSAESRGFDRNTWNSGLTAVAFLWWGDGGEGDALAAVEGMNDKHAWLALPAALSSYRPPASLRAIAHKQIPLPFEMRASHPAYYSYDKSNRLWEVFYATEDYTLGTLLEPARIYQVKGTIRAQYATYKLVARNLQGGDNAAIGLGGTYHTDLGTGRTPGDQYLQKRGAVIYQSILNQKDLEAGVPARSHLVIPAGYGEPLRYKDWYVWRIENVWLCARPWGEEVVWEAVENPRYHVITDRNLDFSVLAAKGTQTAWVTDVARVAEYPTFESLTAALEEAEVDDRSWERDGRLVYRSLGGDLLEMTYQRNGSIGDGVINGEKRVLEKWPVLESPYVRQPLYGGVLEVEVPGLEKWLLRGTLMGPEWE